MTPHRVAAEYVALTVARRDGIRPNTPESDRLAAMVGLPPGMFGRLLRDADATTIATRRAACNRYTFGGAA